MHISMIMRKLGHLGHLDLINKLDECSTDLDAGEHVHDLVWDVPRALYADTPVHWVLYAKK